MSPILKGLLGFGLLIFAYSTCLNSLRMNYYSAKWTLKSMHNKYSQCYEVCAYNQAIKYTIQVRLTTKLQEFNLKTCKHACEHIFH